VAAFAQDAGVPDITGDITQAANDAGTVMYTILGFAVSSFCAGLIMSFARRGIKR